MKRHLTSYIDISFCIVILPLMLYMFPVERWWSTQPVFFAVFVAWLYCTFFLYRRFIVERFFHPGPKRRAALIAVAVSVGVTFLLSCYEMSSPIHHLRQQFMQSHQYTVWGMRPNQQAVWLYHIIIVTFCVAVGMMEENFRQRMAREEVEYERNKAELALYKAQLGPHFLFNTLNTIYGLLITRSDKTQDALEGFIRLTHYMYQNSGGETVPLEDEADYIRQYISLQRLRLPPTAEVRFECRLEDGSVPFPPMLLITLVENAFKYGISANDPCFVHISLLQSGGHLCFEVLNSDCSHPTASGQGTGIRNCRHRLHLLYPDAHRLDTSHRPDGTYGATLDVVLDGLNLNPIQSLRE